MTRRRGDGAQRRSLAALYAAGFVTAFGAHAVAANLGRYATARHASLIELGVLLAVYDGAEVVLKPVFGALSDRIGPKPVLLGGLVCFALASVGFVIAGEPGALGAARLGQGAAAAAFSPAASAMVAALGGTQRQGRSFGGYGAAKGMGYMAGPLLGGVLVTFGGYDLLFGLLAGLALAVAATSWRFVLAVPTSPRRRETIAGLVARLRRREFLRPVLALAGAAAALSAGVGFLPVLGARRHLDAVTTGAAVSVLAALAALVQLRAGRDLDAGRSSTAVMTLGLGAAAAGLALGVTLPGVVGLVTAALLVGWGVGVITPVGFAMLALGAPDGRLGQTMGAGEVGRELGDAGGPLVVGVLSDISLVAGMLGLAALLAVTAKACSMLGVEGRTLDFSRRRRADEAGHQNSESE